VIILDHNIPEDQVQQLREWKIHFRQIGFEVGRPEWDDQQEILRYLHSTNKLRSLRVISASFAAGFATQTIAS